MPAFFDIFDTLVCRRCGGPDAVLWLAGEELLRRRLISVDAGTFAKVRRSAEARLYSRKPDGPGTTIEEIYALLEDAGVLAPGSALEALEVEIELEITFCEAVPGMPEHLAEVRRSGPVVFVSDMYLREATILNILQRCGLWKEGDRLLVSSEAKLWKKDGRLFRRAMELCQARASECCHHGNDRVVDIDGAAKASLPSRFIGQANLNAREAYWDALGPVSNGLGSSIAGASRLARLEVAKENPDRARLAEVAVSVAAPPLIVFVLWLLQRAWADGVDRLFFLARDGQILLRIAEQLAPRLGVEMELHYLHASRQSWFLPSLLTFETARFDWLLRVSRSLTVEQMLLAAGLAKEEMGVALPGGISAEATAIESGSWTNTGRALLEDHSFQEFLMHVAGSRRQVVRSYFEQSGLCSEKNCALVDLGWSGSIQRMGQAILGTDALPAYYFGLRSEQTPPGALAYLGPQFQPRLEQIVQLVEGFCFADHPSVLGFDDENGSIRPRFAENDATLAIKAWGLGVFQDTLVKVARRMELSAPRVSGASALQEAVVQHLFSVNESPSLIEAAVLGDQPWEDGVGNLKTFAPRAKPISLIDLVLHQFPKYKQKRTRAQWPSASVCRSSILVKVGWQFLKLLKKIRRKF